MSVFMITPKEMLRRIAHHAQSKRLSLNLSQQTLAERSGVSYGSLKKFEITGKISLESLVKIALTLGSLDEFDDLFKPKAPENFISLDELLKDTKRKRGRR